MKTFAILPDTLQLNAEETQLFDGGGFTNDLVHDSPSLFQPSESLAITAGVVESAEDIRANLLNTFAVSPNSNKDSQSFSTQFFTKESMAGAKTSLSETFTLVNVQAGFFPENTIYGTSYNDTIYGNSEWGWDPETGTVLTFTDDIIFGMAGDDKLFGMAGDDFLIGGAGSDELHGGSGDDLIAGGASVGWDSGLDQMFGGEGADTFLLGSGGFAHYQDVGDEFVELPFFGEVYGLDQFVVIKDFTAEDTIAAPGVDYGQYYVDIQSYSGAGDDNVQDTLIYFGSNSPFLPLDLVAVVVDYTDSALLVDASI